MSFPVLGIPNATDVPSQSQSLIQSNFNNLVAWAAVDHVTYGTSLQAGEHNQITFAANNVPATPTSPPVLFTNNDGFSIPQLFFYTGTPAQSANQYTASQNGSVMLLGGIILKWGFYGSAIATGSFTTITFPTAFPHSCFVAFAIAAGSAGFVNTFVLGPGSFNIAVSLQSMGVGSSYWMAIGN